jgi:ABC-type multidrug transport system permease subunit
MVMGALGGCWWPLEVVSDTMSTIGHFFPTAWTMDALHRLISFGGELSEITQELAVLAGFGVVANFGAARFFRF